MMAFFDMLPGSPSRRRRRRLRSPQVYARTRESIPTVESISTTAEHNELVADIALQLELEPKVQEELQKSVQELFTKEGPAMFKNTTTAVQESVQAGNFAVSIDTTGTQNEVTVSPEGNIQEKVSLSKSALKTLHSSLS